MAEHDIERAKTDISKALEETFEADGNGFERKLKQARQYLPRRARKDAAYLLEAEKQLKHPKFRRFVDQNRIKSARDNVIRQTRGVDLQADRSRARFQWGASLVLQLLLACALIFAFARFVGVI
ncbi:hypothetical protein GCM10008927_27670 [Amylibacter ulvae]|uniref:Uncharacterized protein n=1 Tax=Paramylibacter ulvae TaxID=1651968 RepID=A0ABQ3DBD6_9RHOB|nr:hypothetical protein [Amylibacter ulvae]GHA60597.1 hypothetical protein GCM10008927_27670 [Amylibacter ulvae]